MKNIRKKVLSLVAAVTFCVSVPVLPVYQEPVVTKAATGTFEQQLSKFPSSYHSSLRALHQKYPNWQFEPLNTGLDFETVVTNEMSAETTASSGNKSLIWKTASEMLMRNEWCDYSTSTGQYIYKDSNAWVSAGRNTVAWFIDPRNWLNEIDIMQFEKNSFDASVHTKAGVQAILAKTFMKESNGKFSYLSYNPSTKKWSEKRSARTYPTVFYEAGKKYNVSPFYLASKSVQELGMYGSDSSDGTHYIGSGSNSGKLIKGLYNFYNIGANDGADPITNGLTFAAGYESNHYSNVLNGALSIWNPAKWNTSTYGRPWNNQAKAITGGAQFFYDNYISQGQNTGYFVRFNVNPTNEGNLYWHQFMTNIAGACQENSTTYYAYKDLGVLSNTKKFLIPVYKNMPDLNNTISINGATNTGIAAGGMNVRSGPGVDYAQQGWLNQGDRVTILKAERTDLSYRYNSVKYPYWYQVRYTQGGQTKTGYVYSEYINLASTRAVCEGDRITVSRKNNADKVYYYSDNPAVAKVSQDGIIDVKSNGVCNIYAFLSNGNMDVVRVQTESFKINPQTLTVDAGAKKTLSLVPKVAGAISWSSSNTAVATVTSGGTVTTKKAGTVTITAKTQDGSKAYSTLTVRPDGTSLKKPTAGSDYVKLSWNPKSGVTGYKIYRKYTWDTNYSCIATVKGSSITSYTDWNVTRGEPYDYCIKTYTGSADSNASAKVSVLVSPGKTSLTSVTPTSGDGWAYNTLSWQRVTNATGYRIYRKATGEKEYRYYTSVYGNEKTQYVDKNVQIGKQYVYCVKVFKKTSFSTKYSGASNKMKVTLRPAATQILSAKSDTAGTMDVIKLSWKKVNDCSGYRIFRKTPNEKSFHRVAEIKGNATVYYADDTANMCEVYEYCIKPVKGQIESARSNLMKVTVRPETTKLWVTAHSKSSVTLNWNKVNKADGYRIYRRLSTDKSYRHIATVKGNWNLSFTDKKVTGNQTYYYLIKTYKRTSAHTQYSVSSNRVTVATK